MSFVICMFRFFSKGLCLDGSRKSVGATDDRSIGQQTDDYRNRRSAASGVCSTAYPNGERRVHATPMMPRRIV